MFNLFKRKEAVSFDDVDPSDLTMNEQTELEGFVNAIPGLKDALYGLRTDTRTVRSYNLVVSHAAINAFVYGHVGEAEYQAYQDTVYLPEFNKSLTGYAYNIHGFTVIRHRVYYTDVLEHFLKDFL